MNEITLTFTRTSVEEYLATKFTDAEWETVSKEMSDFLQEDFYNAIRFVMEDS